MRFESLSVANFKAVRNFEATNLSDHMVVIAGPNGCGKSAVLDAIRLMKSVYGGYQQDEWRNWFGEFQINLARRADLVKLLRNPTKPLRVHATLTLADAERDYIGSNAEILLEPLVWTQLLGRQIDVRSFGSPALATDLRVHGDEVKRRVSQWASELRQALAESMFELELTIPPDLELGVKSSPVLEVIFQTYDPEHLGVIDYHGAARMYQREALGGLNLNLESFEEQRRSQSLYNWQEKYRNVKTELASSYLKELIAREAGAEEGTGDLNQTLRELFQTFFADKEYQGPTPTPEGTLEFPVRLQTGETHDIDELSAGEKEILYGYLRLRNSAPRNSVILIDEPELHLNPGLLQGLPDFYHRHLGRGLNNQLWLVTHSDALLRESVGNPNYSVFHMRTATTVPADVNQAVPIEESELDRAIIDLVGDLATYKPHGKVVILEGGGDTDFDVKVVARLFPELAQRVNLVSGGSKRRVQDLYEVLSATAQQIGLADRFFSITDRDSGRADLPDEAHVLTWSRYHIENYLLETRFVLAAIRAVVINPTLSDEEEVRKALRQSAREVLPRLVLEQLQREANDHLVSSIQVGASPGTKSPAADLRPSIEASSTRLSEAADDLLRPDYLEERSEQLAAALVTALDDGRWVSEVPGRLVIRRFVERHVPGVSYDAFRTLVLDQMVDDKFQPPEMAVVVNAILETGSSPEVSAPQ